MHKSVRNFLAGFIGSLAIFTGIAVSGVATNPAVTGISGGGSGTSADQVQGTAASGSAVSGNPVQVGGSDGTNARTLLTDTGGRAIAVGAATAASAPVGAPVLVGASDGSVVRTVKTDTSGNLFSVGNVAAAATDSGNPLKIGGKYNSTVPTYTDGQRGDAQMDARGALHSLIITNQNSGVDGIANTELGYAWNNGRSGSLILRVAPSVYNGSTWDRPYGDTAGTVVQPALTANRWAYPAASTGITNTTTAVTIKAAAGAGVRNYVTGIQIMSEALTNATELAIRDGAAGTVLWRTKIGTGGLTQGISHNFQVPLKGTANTLLEVVTLTASGAGAVYFNAQGYTAP